MLSYVTAYLKNYFPAEFYASLMSLESKKTTTESKLQQYISDCYQKHIKILPPDVNESKANFTAVDGKVRFGLECIKGVGGKALKDILNKKPFSSIFDFYDRVNKRLVNKTAVEALIEAGAFDEYDKNRNRVHYYYYQLRNNGKVKYKLWQPYDDVTKDDIISMELRRLKMSVTYPSILDLLEKGGELKINGILIDRNIFKTNNDNLMCFAELETKKNIIKLIVLPQKYNKYKKVIRQLNKKVTVLGEKGNDGSMIVKAMKKGVW
ncbi:MAG: hypothetical protein ACOC56_05600, partial [Atribacterota bacterium]